jgi:hypothetical protein
MFRPEQAIIRTIIQEILGTNKKIVIPFISGIIALMRACSGRNM